MFKAITLSALVCAATFSVAPAYAQTAVEAEKQGSAVTEKYQAAMKEMNKKMKAEPKAGNADHDFIVMMIEHHRGAIAMGEILVKDGKNEELREMVQKSMTMQREEIKKLEEILEKVKDNQDTGAAADSKENPTATATPESDE